jgi:hypothetical protein
MAQGKEKESLRQRWDKVRPTKQVLFWFCLGSVVGAVFIGFVWGGWVTGGTARDMAEQSGEDAVVDRLATICVYQFNQDPDKDQKLTEMKEKSSYQRDDYVIEQGWATMPGEEKPDNKVAVECAKRLSEISQ